jgi:hypothetical protein
MEVIKFMILKFNDQIATSDSVDEEITNILFNQDSFNITFAVYLDVFQSCLSDLRRKSINHAAKSFRRCKLPRIVDQYLFPSNQQNIACV